MGDQSLDVGFIPINTWQQRASLPFKPGVLERKVYNNDDITFFSIFTFDKPSVNNVLQPSLLLGSEVTQDYFMLFNTLKMCCIAENYQHRIM